MKQKCCPATELIQLPEFWTCQVEVYMGYIPLEHLLIPTPFYTTAQSSSCFRVTLRGPRLRTPPAHQCAHPFQIDLLLATAMIGERLGSKTQGMKTMVFL